MSEQPLVYLDPEQIIIPPRLRDLDSAHVDNLTGMIRMSKSVTPIQVYVEYDQEGEPSYLLIAGNHRIHACKRVGITVPALIEDKAKADLLEIVENYTRLELSAAEKVIHAQRLLELFESEGVPDTGLRSRPGKTGQLKAHLNIADKTAQNLRKKAENISADVLGLVQGTKLDTVAMLEKLADLPSEEAQIKRIELEEQKLKTKVKKRGNDAPPELNNVDVASKAIAEILVNSLPKTDVVKIKGLLEITDRRALINKIDELLGT